jgi:glutamyl-tRNA(Gln) amidotransferase subunit E
MPLIEPVTNPDMRTPQAVGEVGETIRKLLRATGKVRTGYGAGRQDVNVSVTGGTRIEIKGVPRIPKIPRLVYNEAMRQWNLLRIRDLLKERGITSETFSSKVYDVTRTLTKTRYNPIVKALERDERIRCVKLNGFAGILNEQTQTDTHFAKEISDRVRVIACLTRLPNIAHSDLASEQLSSTDWKLVRKRTKAGPDDTLVLVWGQEEDMITACQEIQIRAREALLGVPSETRQALKDGTTGFERILPGPQRMYPDTDLPPKALLAERISRTKALLPERPWEREERYASYNLPEDILDEIVVSRKAKLFDRLVDELKIKPQLAGAILFRCTRALRRSGLNPILMSEDEIFCLFKAFQEGLPAREGILKVIRHLLAKRREDPEERDGDPEHTIRTALAELKLEPVSMEELKARVLDAAQRAEPGAFATADKKHRFLMGVLMNDLLGRVEGALVSRTLEAAMKRDKEQV